MPIGDGKGFNGHDSLGEFKILMGAPYCRVCERRSMVCIRYLASPKVNAYVAKAKSLLIHNKKTGNFIRTIGINCGCYAKVHRQIAHIEGGKK